MNVRKGDIVFTEYSPGGFVVDSVIDENTLQVSSIVTGETLIMDASKIKHKSRVYDSLASAESDTQLLLE